VNHAYSRAINIERLRLGAFVGVALKGEEAHAGQILSLLKSLLKALRAAETCPKWDGARSGCGHAGKSGAGRGGSTAGLGFGPRTARRLLGEPRNWHGRAMPHAHRSKFLFPGIACAPGPRPALEEMCPAFPGHRPRPGAHRGQSLRQESDAASDKPHAVCRTYLPDARCRELFHLGRIDLAPRGHDSTHIAPVKRAAGRRRGGSLLPERHTCDVAVCGQTKDDPVDGLSVL
jgi:hypothetical protein